MSDTIYIAQIQDATPPSTILLITTDKEEAKRVVAEFLNVDIGKEQWKWSTNGEMAHKVGGLPGTLALGSVTKRIVIDNSYFEGRIDRMLKLGIRT